MSILPPWCHFLLSWFSSKSGSMGVIYMMSLQFAAPASLSSCAQIDRFFPKMVKKCTGRLFSQRRVLCYICLCNHSKELFTLSKNGGKGKKNHYCALKNAGWNARQTRPKTEWKWFDLWKLHRKVSSLYGTIYFSHIYLGESSSVPPPKHAVPFHLQFYKIFQSQTEFLPTPLLGKKAKNPPQSSIVNSSLHTEFPH